MADISEELQIIAEGRYGDDVKNAIIEAIQKLNNEAFNSVKEIREYMKVVTPLLNKFTVCPSGTLSISANGSYDVADYDMANVNIPEPSLPVEIADGMRLSLPLVSMIGSCAFAHCSTFQLVLLSNATIIDNEAFFECESLRGISAPMVERVGAGAFLRCIALSSVIMSNCAEIEHEAFYSCTALQEISFPNALAIGSGAFRGCDRLSSAYFLGNSVPVLSASDAFTMTPIQSDFSGYYGSIYVLPSMVDAFKAAENWSYYSARITGYEGG